MSVMHHLLVLYSLCVNTQQQHYSQSRVVSLLCFWCWCWCWCWTHWVLRVDSCVHFPFLLTPWDREPLGCMSNHLLLSFFKLQKPQHHWWAKFLFNVLWAKFLFNVWWSIDQFKGLSLTCNWDVGWGKSSSKNWSASIEARGQKPLERMEGSSLTWNSSHAPYGQAHGTLTLISKSYM